MRRVYRAKNSLKAFYIVFLTFSLLFLVGAWRGKSTGSNTWFDLAIAIVLVAAGAVLAVQTLTVRVVLSENAIYQGSVFNNRSIQLDQILYRREYEKYLDSPEGGSYVQYLEFIPVDSETKSLRISKDDFHFDSEFWERVLRIPELDS